MGMVSRQLVFLPSNLSISEIILSIRHKISIYFRKKCGASAVEFALLSPLLIILFVGTLDVGVFVWERMKLQNMTRTVAEYVVHAESDDNADVIAEETYTGNFADITLTSEFTCECANGIPDECPQACESGDYQRRFINISSSGTFEPLFPYPFISEGLVLQSSVRMRVD